MNDTNEAQQYAQSIADEIRALDKALSGGEEAAEALKVLEMHDRDDAEGDWFSLWLNETALDLSVRLDVRGAEYGATVVVLRTSGGPRCEVVWENSDANNVEVLAWWASDYGRTRLYLPNFAERLRDLVEAFSAADVIRHRQ